MNMKKALLLFAIIAVVFTACNTSTEKKDKKNNSAQSNIASRSNVIHPEWTKNANIYEVNLRQFSPEGTLNAFTRNLPRLKNMGVDILWFMPIHPIG